MNAIVKVSAVLRVLFEGLRRGTKKLTVRTRRFNKRIMKALRSVNVHQTLTAFWRKLRAEWKGYTSCLLLGMLLTIVCVRTMAAEAPAELTEPSAPSVITEPTDELVEQAEASVALAAANSEETIRDGEAMAMARVIYGTARSCSADAQRAVCWCIINRVENPIYPDSVERVCKQDQQWMGYSDDNPVLEDIYQTCRSVVDTWHEGGRRPIGPEFLYLTWRGTEIELRDTFTVTGSTRYWRG